MRRSLRRSATGTRASSCPPGDFPCDISATTVQAGGKVEGYEILNVASGGGPRMVYGASYDDLGQAVTHSAELASQRANFGDVHAGHL